MAGTKKPNTVSVAEKIGLPVAQELGLEIWDVRFEKEGSTWFLRYFIDKPGGVDINDCEQFSRKVDKLFDEHDPIDQSYCLEVSSPGVERDLVRDKHFLQYIGSRVYVRFIRPVEGNRDFDGILTAYSGGEITILIEDDVEMSFNKTEAAYVRLFDDFDYGGAK